MKFYHIEKEVISPGKWSYMITVFDENRLAFFLHTVIQLRLKGMSLKVNMISPYIQSYITYFS